MKCSDTHKHEPSKINNLEPKKSDDVHHITQLVGGPMQMSAFLTRN